MPSPGGKYAPVVDAIVSKYPKLQGYDWNVTSGEGRGHLEFYSPDEPSNPAPGRPTIEVRNPNLQGEALERAVFGDMLHYLPQVDPQYEEMRQGYYGLMTPMQRVLDRKTHFDATQPIILGHPNQWYYGENRPFDQWMDVSRLDAHLRGFLAPDERNEWANAYTPEQRQHLMGIREYLKK